MKQGLRVVAVVPCHNESAFVGRVVAGLPGWVDHVLVVDDHSEDDTVAVARALPDARLEVVALRPNRGVGGAIVAGYRRALELGADVVLVTNGDAQMHGGDAEALVEPVARGVADLVKGNRLLCAGTRGNIPVMRRLGISVLSAMTRAASSQWHLGDLQSGYHAISARALRSLPLDALWPRFGFPNDLCLRAAEAGLRVEDRPVRAIYGAEVSDLRARHVWAIARVCARSAARRWVGA